MPYNNETYGWDCDKCGCDVGIINGTCHGLCWDCYKEEQIDECAKELEIICEEMRSGHGI